MSWLPVKAPRRSQRMRRSLAIRSLVISTITVAIFSIPLSLLVRSQAKERALTFGRSDARALAPIVSLAGSPNVTGAVFSVGQRAVPRVVEVVFSDGSVLGADEVVEPDPLDDPAALNRARLGEAFSKEIRNGAVIYEPVPRSNGTTAVVRVFVPDSLIRRGVARSLALLGALGIALIALSVLGADRLGRSLVRSVNNLAERANRLGQGDVSERVAIEGPEEVRKVGVALNNLADRIDELIGTERNAVADLQHRMRTPVTALRAEVGTLRGSDLPVAQRLESGLEELTRTIDQIIRDAAQPTRRGIGITCDLGLVTKNRFAFWEVLAEDQGREATLEINGGPFPVGIMESDLTSVIDALIDNVFSHTGEHVAFHITVTNVGEFAELSVKDGGNGLASGFDLQRGSSTRGSTGLGLDIARRIASSADGEFVIRNAASQGTVALLRLPRLGG
jgi:signal transduction histidine kinase